MFVSVNKLPALMATREDGLVRMLPVGATLFPVGCMPIPFVTGKFCSCSSCLDVIRIVPADGALGRF